jgi:hypothetical protein
VLRACKATAWLLLLLLLLLLLAQSRAVRKLAAGCSGLEDAPTWQKPQGLWLFETLLLQAIKWCSSDGPAGQGLMVVVT